MVEGRVNHRVRLLRASRDTGGVFENSAERLCARVDQRPGAGVRARHAQHRMPRREEFGNDTRADKAGSASQENTHGRPPTGRSRRVTDRKVLL